MSEAIEERSWVTSKLEPSAVEPGFEPQRLKPGPVIRVWRMGDLEHGIIPTKEQIDHLADILRNSNPDDGMDLIWGPDLKVSWIPTGPGVDFICGPGVKFVPVDEKTVRVEAV